MSLMAHVLEILDDCLLVGVLGGGLGIMPQLLSSLIPSLGVGMEIC